MAAALLASPSTYSPPNSPFSSDSFSDSPNLPAISSPFDINKQSYSKYPNNNDDTPTRPSLTPIIGNEQPSWVTDELDEEWLEQDEGEDDDDEIVEERYEETEKGDDGSTTYSGSPTITKQPSRHSSMRQSIKSVASIGNSYNSASPEAFLSKIISKTTTTTTTTNLSELESTLPSSDTTFSPPGTFIIRENSKLGGSMEERINPHVREGENQLQAAVRALKGPSSGLGAGSTLVEPGDVVNIESGEMATPQMGKKAASGGDRLGGLMSLFRPLSPPLPALPASTIPAPSIDLFTFSPPVISARTSWKSLPHFSPADNNTTPKPRAYYETSTPTNLQGGVEGEDLTTPMRHDEKGLAPPMKAKERYLRSSNTTEATSTVSIEVNTAAPLIDFEDADGKREETPLEDDLHTPFPTTPAPQAIHSFQYDESNQNTPRTAAAAGLRLFEFQYDTFTRDHLAALVEEIDGLGSLRVAAVESKNSEDQAWETSFVDVPPSASQLLEQESGIDEEYEGEAGRSSKRIRLSPPSVVSEPRNRSNFGDRNGRTTNTSGTGASAITGGRSRRHRNSPSPRSITPITNSMRDRSLDFAKSMNVSARRTSVPTTSSSSTRDRLGEANLLMDRMRSQSGLRSSVSRATQPRQPDIEFANATSEFLSANITVRSRSNSPRKQTTRSHSPEVLDGAQSSAPRIINRLEPSHLRPNTENILSSSAPVFRPTAQHPSTFSHSTAQSQHYYRGENGQEDLASASVVRVSPPLSHAVVATQLSSNTPINILRRTGLITTIGPNDIDPALLASASAPSRMVFDKELGKWIKGSRISSRITSGLPLDLNSTQRREEEDQDPFYEDASKSSEDPFKSFDNSRITSEMGDSSPIIKDAQQEVGLSGLGISAGTPITLALPISVPISPLDANYFDSSPVERPAQTGVSEQDQQVEWGDRTHYSEEEDYSGQEEEDGVGSVEEESPYHLFSRVMESHTQSDNQDQHEAVLRAPHFKSPERIRSTSDDPNITPRSQRSTSLSPTVPFSLPRSALKPTVRSNSDPGTMSSTPISKISANTKAAPRSVSFSDGKSTGQIEGLVNDVPVFNNNSGGSRLKYEMEKDVESEEDQHENSSEMIEHSVRMETAISSLDDMPSFTQSVVPLEDPSRAALTRQQYVAPTPTYRRTTSADATFLTEASFSISRDNLVRLIADVEPSESDWNAVRSLNLSGKNVDSLIRLKEFLPQLDEVDFTNNQITFLTGIPSTVRTLLLSSNKISSFASFFHLRNLERIDVSNNNLDSLSQFACLQHLRELKADNNQIMDLSGISSIDGLLRLSLKNNQIEEIDFSKTKWSRIETLNISRNKVRTLQGLNRLQSLSILNLDHNLLDSISSESSLPRLRVLRLCSNPIKSIDIAFAPSLRTLFIDGANLGAVEGTSQLRKLENLSVRDQNGAAVTLIMKDVRDVKRLYLSGNAVPTSFPTEQFFNLVYLELAMCQLTSLPVNLASLIPNVRVLNLNFNFIDDLTPLTGLTRLNKLTVLGARLEKCRPIAKVLASMPELELLDLRLNPFTLPFYPPLILQHPSEILAPHSEYQILHPHDDPASHHWPSVDSKFRKNLPDLWYFKRMTYRAVLMETSKSLISLDGIECAKERPRLAKMLGFKNEEMRN